MERIVGFSAAALLVASFCGCRSCEFVEAELRHQTNRVEELESQLEIKDAEISRLNTVVSQLHGRLTQERPPLPPEARERGAAMARMSIGAATGGRDPDRDGDDDLLQCVVTPVDVEGDSLKCSGTVQITVDEQLPTGERRPVGSWKFDPAVLAKRWRSTFVGQGYQFDLAWQTPPTQESLHIHVRFTTLDGRQFAAERDVRVALPKTSKP
jgi:hypothetical protein